MYNIYIYAHIYYFRGKLLLNDQQHDLEEHGKLRTQLAISTVLITFMHYYFEYTQPLYIQVCIYTYIWYKRVICDVCVQMCNM